jgi:hypothetical protein
LILKAKKAPQGKIELIGSTWPRVVAWMKEGVEYTLEIKKPTKSRTLPQNRTYHMLREWWRQRMLEDGNVFTPSESETMFKYWLGWYDEVEYITKDGEVQTKEIPRSTHDLTTEQFSELFTLIATRAQEWWPETQLPVIDL